MNDAIILSDLHLGSHNCEASRLCEFLEEIHEGRLQTSRLILNGDVFDSFDFRRLNKVHWRVLSLIRKLSNDIEITWICGNHDGSAEVVSHLLGVAVRDEHILESGSERVLLLHGHVFDEFLDAHPILTWVGDMIYYLLQKMDRTHRFAKMAKHGSKTFLRCAQKIEDGTIARAQRLSCSVVCCGHTHLAISKQQDNGVRYFNSGCWTELPCTYLTIADGAVALHSWQPSETPVETPAEELVPAG